MRKKLEIWKKLDIIKIEMKNFLHHLFLPRETNNHRPRVLHHSFLFVVVILFFVSGFVLSDLRQRFPFVLGTNSNISEQQLLIYTNQKRQENGLAPLSIDSQLSQAANGKASHMFSNGYWAHNAPDGTTPWFFIKGAGYNYVYAGENLARGFSSAEEVVNAWMASPEHKKNMLSSNYKHVGFSVQTGNLGGEDTVLVVEMLGSNSFGNFVAKNEPTKQVEPTAVPTQSSPIVEVDLSPTSPPPSPTLTPVPTLNPQLASSVLEAQRNQNPESAIDTRVLSANVTRATTGVFIFSLIIDMIYIERKKVVRVVGHNLDHVIFLSLIFILITIILRGAIL